MTVDVQTEIVIERPIDAVASYAADPSNAPEWYANIDSVEWKTAPPIAVGSAVEFVARFLGRKLNDRANAIVQNRPSIAAIARVKGREAPDLLLRALGDDDWRVRKEAVAVAPLLDPRDETIAMLVAALLLILGALANAIGIQNAAAKKPVEQTAKPEPAGATSGGQAAQERS